MNVSCLPTKRQTILKGILPILLALSFVACGSNGGEDAEKPLLESIDSPPAGPSPTLTLSLTESTVTVSNQSTASCSDGTPPYTWSIVSGPATVNASGVVTPSGSGTVVVRATDSQNEYGVIQLTVQQNLSVTSAKRFLVYLESSSVTVTGGVPTVSGAVQSGALSIAGTTVTAGSTQGTGSILWTDALGNQSSVNYSIEPPVVASATVTTVTTNGSSTVSAVGGYPTYVFSITSGGGSVNPSTGVFTAPSVPGSLWSAPLINMVMRVQ